MVPSLFFATAALLQLVLTAQSTCHFPGDRQPDGLVATPQPARGLELLGVALPASLQHGRVELRLSAAAPNGTVVAVLGFEHAAVALPGGAILGLNPLLVPTLGLANATGRADLSWSFPAAGGTGLAFLAAAIALDPTQVWGSPQSLQVTRVLPMQVPATGSHADLVVLFGQSNAEGHADTADLPNGLQGPQPRLRIWNDYTSAWEALHAGRNNQLIPDVPRFGPEVGFCIAANSATAPIWLVKCAVSQSSLGPMPGPWNEWGPAAGELYPELLRRIDAAAKGIRSIGLEPRVRLICMMQGETDAIDATSAAAYGARLVDLLQSLRADLAARQLIGSSTVAFRVGLVSPLLPPQVFSYSDLVRAGQRSTAATLAHCEVVETGSLELHADLVHFAAAGLLSLGRLFALGLPR